MKKFVIFAVPLLASSSAGFVFFRFVSVCDEVVGDDGVLRFVEGGEVFEDEDWDERRGGGVEVERFVFDLVDATSISSSSSSEISNTSLPLPLDNPAADEDFAFPCDEGEAFTFEDLEGDKGSVFEVMASSCLGLCSTFWLF